MEIEEILIQEKCVEPLMGNAKMPSTLTQSQKNEMSNKVRSVIVSYLVYKVLSEVTKGKTPMSIWTMMELLYMTKSLFHRQFLKQQIYSSRMD